MPSDTVKLVVDNVTPEKLLRARIRKAKEVAIQRAKTATDLHVKRIYVIAAHVASAWEFADRPGKDLEGILEVLNEIYTGAELIDGVVKKRR